MTDTTATTAPAASSAHPARFAADRAHLPVALYLLFMLLAFGLGLGALWVNREHAYTNLNLLQLPPEALFVRQRSVDLFAAAHLVLIFLVAILPRERFGSLRLRMGVVALLVVGYETAAMYQSRFGIALSGQAAATADEQRVADLKRQIERADATSTGLLASANAQAKSKIAASRSEGHAALLEARANNSRADALSAELAQLQRQKAPAEIEIWGDWMPYKAAAESVLVTLLSMLMFSTAGNMGRAARDAHLTRHPAKAGKAGKAATGPALPQWSTKMPSPSPAYAAAALPLGAAGAGAVPVYAPPLPSQPVVSAPADVSTRTHASPERVFTQTHAPQGKDVSTRTHAAPEATPERVSTQTHAQGDKDVFTQTHASDKATSPTVGQSKTRPPRATKPRQPTAVADGAKIDTGVIPGSNSRYLRVMADVQAGRIKPTVLAIQDAHGGGPTVARRYQQEMLRTGVIVPREKGKGYRLA